MNSPVAHMARFARAPGRSGPAKSRSPGPAARALISIGLLLFACLLCGSGERLEIDYAIRYDTLHVAFRVEDHLTPGFLERADSGLTAALTIRVLVLPLSGDGFPAGPAKADVVLRCEVQYDLWAERYLVTTVDGPTSRQWTTATRDQAVSICARVGWLPLVSLEDLDLRRNYLVEVVVDTEPDRPSAKERTREHLGDPARGTADGTGGRSLFGAMVQALFRERADEETPVSRLQGLPFGGQLLSRALAESESEEEEGVQAIGHGEEEEE